MKRRLFVQRLCATALALTISTTMVVPVFADNGAIYSEQEKVAQATSIGSVYISNHSYFEIEQAAILPSDEGQMVTFKVRLHNGDNHELSFIDYWVRLQTQAGTQFSVNLMPQDKDKNRVASGSEETISFYAKVNDSTNLQDLVFKFIQWDFSVANFERSLGLVTVPWDYSQLTRSDEKRTVNVGGTQLKTGVTRFVVNKNDEQFWVSLSYNLENMGSKSVALPGYTFAIRTSEGLVYPLDGTGAKDLSVHPRASKKVELTGTIPASIAEGGWELVVTELESTTKIQLPVAFYQLPVSTTDDTTTPIQGKKVVQVGGVPIAVSVGRVSMNKNDISYQTTVYIHLENEGNVSVSVPKYEFLIRTAEGLSYPVTTEGLDNLSILPRSRKDIALRVNIPIAVQVSQLELVMNQPIAASDAPTGSGTPGFRYPVVVFTLPSPTQNVGNVGTTSEFSNKNGVYGLTFNGVQRLPWEELDIITADLSLTNQGLSSLPIPALTGYFLLDGSIKVPAKLVQTDNVISVVGDKKIGFQLYGTIPYTYEYTDLVLIVQEKISETETNDLVQFKNDRADLLMPFIGTGEGYSINGVGRHSKLSIRKSRTYNGVDSSLFAVQLSVENLEKRFTNISNLVGYFKTKDDLMFPAQITEVKQKVSPLGKAILNVTTPLPLHYDTTQMELIIGEGVKDTKLADGATVPDAYIHGVTFSIPGETKIVQDHFNKLDIFPYTLTLNQLSASMVNIEKFAFKFDYTLSKNTFAETSGDDEHKIIVEFSDVNGGVEFSQSFALDKSSDPEAEGNLALGHHTRSILKSDSAILIKLPYLTRYKINVYDEYLGQKNLLASQSFEWFVTSQ